MKSYIGAGTYWSDDHHTGVRTEHPQVDDNRWHHRFGSSWLKTADLCLERARLEHEHTLPDVVSDAASVGTATHTAIETCLHEHHEGVALDLSTTLDVFHMEFSELMTDDAFAWMKYTEKSARAFGERCLRQWWYAILPTLPQNGWLERTFVLPFVDDDERVIELSGAIDYGPALKDWKTAGRPYQEWEYKRWAIQPSVYTWAAAKLGLVDRIMEDEIEMPTPFEYVVLGGKSAHRFTVQRGPEHWEFLRMKVTNIARLIEAELAPWPLSDNHALCSEKWCPAWSVCKGSTGIKF